MPPEDQYDLPIEREEYEIWARKQEVKALRQSLVVLMDMIEKGVLVRNTSAEGSITALREQSVGLALALKQAQDAINLGRIPDRTVEVFADHAEECEYPIGLTTCGYPRAHRIHNDEHLRTYHKFSIHEKAEASAPPKEEK